MDVSWVSGIFKILTISILFLEQHLNNIICPKKDRNYNWKLLFHISNILLVYEILYF